MLDVIVTSEGCCWLWSQVTETLLMYDAVNGPPVAQSPSGRSLLPFSLDDIQYKDVQSLRQSSEQSGESGLVLPLNNCRTHAHTHTITHIRASNVNWPQSMFCCHQVFWFCLVIIPGCETFVTSTSRRSSHLLPLKRYLVPHQAPWSEPSMTRWQYKRFPLQLNNGQIWIDNDRYTIYIDGNGIGLAASPLTSPLRHPACLDTVPSKAANSASCESGQRQIEDMPMGDVAWRWDQLHGAMFGRLATPRWSNIIKQTHKNRWSENITVIQSLSDNNRDNHDNHDTSKTFQLETVSRVSFLRNPCLVKRPLASASTMSVPRMPPAA